MKVAKSFSIDNKLWNLLIDRSSKTGLKPSVIVSKALEKYFSESEYKVITCPVCGALYSNKLEKCPNCEILRAEKEKAEAPYIEYQKKVSRLNELNRRLIHEEELYNQEPNNTLLDTINTHKAEILTIKKWLDENSQYAQKPNNA